MVATGLTLQRRKSHLDLSVRVRTERFPFRSERIWWRFPPEYGEHLRLSGDPLLPALLLPCMMRQEHLLLEAPVSVELLEAVPAIQAYYRRLVKRAWEVEVRAPALQTVRPAGPGVGCFFSGGADSFYSLLKNEETHPEGDGRITHLIFVAGFDIKLKKRDLLRRVRTHLVHTAEAAGKEYLDVSTNVKAFGDRSVSWQYYFGAVLASVGLALGPLFRTLIISSSYAWQQMILDGSHPELDILWSTGRTAFVHDGCEAARAEKIAKSLSHSELALEHLRVCWRTRDVVYNCGVCEKCLRTMISLYIGTGRTVFPTFPQPLRAEDVSVMDLGHKQTARLFAEENLQLLEGRSGLARELYEALRVAIERARTAD